MDKQRGAHWSDRAWRFASYSIIASCVLCLIARIGFPALVEDDSTTNWVGAIVWSLSVLIGWRLSRGEIAS